MNNDVKRWTIEAPKNATHLIVVTDTFDYEDYPVYVKKNESLEEIKKRYDNVNMQRIMEVIDLKEKKENTKNICISITKLEGNSFEEHEHVKIYEKVIKVPKDKSLEDILKSFSIEVYDCDKKGVLNGKVVFK